MSMVPLARSLIFFFFSSRRRHTRFKCDWSSDVCSSDLDFNRELFEVLGILSKVEVLGTEEVALARLSGKPGAAETLDVPEPSLGTNEIGRASCRERV